MKENKTAEERYNEKKKRKAFRDPCVWHMVMIVAVSCGCIMHH
jgi:hypothetical protein